MKKDNMQMEHVFEIEVKAWDVINDAFLEEDEKYAGHIKKWNDFIKSSSSESVA